MTLTRHLKTYLAFPLAAGALSVALAAPVQAQEHSFRMATIDVETGTYFNTIAVPFAELVGQLTNGEVEIQPLPAGTVGSVFKLHEALNDGLVDMVNWPASFLGTADPTNAMIGSFPTGLGVDSMLPWIYFGGGEDLLIQHRAQTMGVQSMVLGSGPSEWFAHSHVPIETVEDLEGLKYRTLGNWAAIVADQFNASSTTAPGSEVYSMLEKKGLDLAEYSMPGENWNQGLHETAEYIIYPGIHAPAWTFELMIDQEKWDDLSDAHKMAIRTAARIVTYDSMSKIVLADLDAVVKVNERAAEGKNKIIELSDEFKAKSREAARAWATKVSAEATAAGNDWPQQVFDSIVAFQDKWQATSYYMVTDRP
jgi:TRAP-type mannitol/chloroaromatic compound transport system substrate-binding protein